MTNKAYKTLCSMIDTLLEATEILINCKDEIEKEKLYIGIEEFANAIWKFCEKLEDCSELADEIRTLLQHLFQIEEDAKQCIQLLECIKQTVRRLYDSNFCVEQLKEETNFIRYIELLQWAAERYCIIIASSDTPCGSLLFTHNMAQELCKIGIKTDLSDKFRASYVAIIDGGKTIAEKLSFTESVIVEETINDACITIKSSGMNVKDSSSGIFVRITKNNESVLNQSTDMPPLCRGLLFIVFDKEQNIVYDIVGFDTYIPNLTCIRKESSVVKKIEEDNPGVTFIAYTSPQFATDNYSENERYILNNNIDYSLILGNPSIKSEIGSYIKEEEGIREVLTPPTSYINVNGARRFENHVGKYLNTINGCRKTVGQPAKPKRTIYMIGGCGTAGIGVRDEGTYASQLQMLLNMYVAEKGFIVENYGFPLDGMDVLKEEVAIVNSLALKSGDIVIGLGHNSYGSERNYIKDRYKYGEIFFDKKHLTEAGNKLVAEGLFLTLRENNFFEETLCKKQSNKINCNYKQFIPEEQLNELEKYKKSLSELWKNKMHMSDNVGAIVMNCNPFTLGHRYLIEQALKKCEYLIVFVVQEDKSFFSYKDRFELVRLGTQDLSNVFVIGSGNYIISSLTFQSYFNKATLQDRIIDCTDDVTIFVNEIAPAANIRIRFVGEEPIDNVTNQYNRALERILPMNGIEFIEIPRIKIGDKVISASEVRRLLKEKKWMEIKKNVPESTFQYLIENFQ